MSLTGDGAAVGETLHNHRLGLASNSSHGICLFFGSACVVAVFVTGCKSSDSLDKKCAASMVNSISIDYISSPVQPYSQCLKAHDNSVQALSLGRSSQSLAHTNIHHSLAPNPNPRLPFVLIPFIITCTNFLLSFIECSCQSICQSTSTSTTGRSRRWQTTPSRSCLCRSGNHSCTSIPYLASIHFLQSADSCPLD